MRCSFSPSFFSFHRVAPAALSFSERPFFWMQNRWPTLWCIFVKKFSECWPTRQTSRHDVASKRLGFHDRYIGFARNGKKIVRRVAMDQAGCPEVIRHRDLVQRLSVQLQRPNPATNKRMRFNRRAQTDDANVIAVLDLKLARELR